MDAALIEPSWMPYVRRISFARYVLVNYDLNGQSWETVRQYFGRAGVHHFPGNDGGLNFTVFHMTRVDLNQENTSPKNELRRYNLWQAYNNQNYSNEVWVFEKPRLTADEIQEIRTIRAALTAEDFIFLKPGKQVKSPKQNVLRIYTKEDQARGVWCEAPNLLEVPLHVRPVVAVGSNNPVDPNDLDDELQRMHAPPPSPLENEPIVITYDDNFAVPPLAPELHPLTQTNALQQHASNDVAQPSLQLLESSSQANEVTALKPSVTNWPLAATVEEKSAGLIYFDMPDLFNLSTPSPVEERDMSQEFESPATNARAYTAAPVNALTRGERGTNTQVSPAASIHLQLPSPMNNRIAAKRRLLSTSPSENIRANKKKKLGQDESAPQNICTKKRQPALLGSTYLKSLINKTSSLAQSHLFSSPDTQGYSPVVHDPRDLQDYTIAPRQSNTNEPCDLDNFNQLQDTSVQFELSKKDHFDVPFYRDLPSNSSSPSSSFSTYLLEQIQESTDRMEEAVEEFIEAKSRIPETENKSNNEGTKPNHLACSMLGANPNALEPNLRS